MNTYRGFGTYENSILQLITLSIVHLEPFDGPWLEDKDYIRIWFKPQTVEESFSYIILDPSEPDSNPS